MTDLLERPTTISPSAIPASFLATPASDSPTQSDKVALEELRYTLAVEAIRAMLPKGLTHPCLHDIRVIFHGNVVVVFETLQAAGINVADIGLETYYNARRDRRGYLCVPTRVLEDCLTALSEFRAEARS